MNKHLSGKLFVDLSVICVRDPRSGIQRATLGIVKALQANESLRSDLVLVCAGRESPYREILEFVPGGGSTLGEIVNPEKGDIFLGLDLAADILPHHQRRFAKWRSTGVVIAVVVYDLLPISNPRWFSLRLNLRFRRWLRFVSTQADIAICISNDVARNLADWRKAYFWRMRVPLKICSIQLGSDIEATRSQERASDSEHDLLSRLGDRRPILAVGTIEPRKGFADLIDAMERIWADASDPTVLVIVGQRGWKTSALQARIENHSEINRRLFWLNSASEAALHRLYDLDPILVVASHGEGFGLPIVEGLDRGNLVLARDLPVFRELAHDNLHFFKGNSAKELAAEIVKARSLPKVPARVAVTWADAALQLLSQIDMTRLSG